MQKLKIITDDPSFTSGIYKKEEDAFNHEAFAQTVFRVVQDNDPPLTVGLFGGWGVGKTSIVNLLKSKCKGNGHSFIYFNAWQYSGDSFRRQFLLTVAGSEDIITEESERQTAGERLQKLSYKDIKAKKKETFHWSKAGFKNLGIFLLTVAIGILFIIWGGWTTHIASLGAGIFILVASIIAIIYQRLEQIIRVDVETIVDPQLIFPEQFTEEFHGMITKAMKKNGSKKIIIVIDDLDRCDIDTIKDVLVSLKNFLGNNQCFFIIPMDDSSVVQMFKGKNTNFGYEQLRKYFTVSLRIPAFHQEDLLHFAREVSAKYEIPTSIVYIAAVGYCRDARKIKHFLNMFQLKYALAEERAKAGYLGDLSLEGVIDQLAKLVVLEYQFPEFFQFISLNPETIDTFDQAARDLEPVELAKMTWKEFGEGYTGIDDLWRNQPGLRQFLRATDNVQLNNFELLSKLKTSNQEFTLGEFGIRLRKWIEQGIDFEYDIHLTAEYLSSNGRSIVDALSTWLNPDVPPVAKRAYISAKRILGMKMLQKEIQADLARSTISIVLHPKIAMTISVQDAVILLDNLDLTGQFQQSTFVKKMIQEIFVIDRYEPEYWRLIGHKAIKKILSMHREAVQNIDLVVQKWLSTLKTVPEKELFVYGISQVQLSKDERTGLGLIFPSNDLLTSLAASISTESVELNKAIFALLTDEKNPESFSEKQIGLGKKLSVVFSESIVDDKMSSTLLFTCEAIREMPDWLDAESANTVSSLIINQYKKYTANSELEQALLETLLLCYPSLKDVAQTKKVKDSYDSFADLLPPDRFETHIERILLGPFDETSILEVLIPESLNRRISSIEREIESPDDTIIGNARLCRKYKQYIGEEKYNELLSKLFNLKDANAIEGWSPFMVEEITQSNDERVNSLLDSTVSSLKNSSLPKAAREHYGKLLIKILYDEITVSRGKSYYEMLFVLLGDDDLVNVGFVVDSFDSLHSRFGDEVPEQNIDDEVRKLLAKQNLGSYSGTVNIYLGYQSSITLDSCHEIVSKTIAELPNDLLNVDHRYQLLHLLGGISNAGERARDISEVLFKYKETGSVNELKTKAYEIYEHLTRNDIVAVYLPPAKSEPAESTAIKEEKNVN
ncbi:MAG: P-loop NTPase fold protein [Bacteroidota bacterium]|nr:P-loop NTPase fold protein [Bacteroidota bacterium]